MSIERKISSIRNLFMYLNAVLEDENQDPLLKRNVMVKVKNLRTNRKTDEAVSELKGKILMDEKAIDDFIRYIDEEYMNDIQDNKQALYNSRLSKERLKTRPFDILRQPRGATPHIDFQIKGAEDT